MLSGKRTIKRKNAGTKKKGNPQRNTLRISIHRTQAVGLLLVFSLIGVFLGVGLWKAGSKTMEIIDRSSLYDRLIVKYGREYGIDPTLLKAVIWKESNFDKNSRGSKGELGLMQILPDGAVKDWENTFHRKIPSEGVLMDPNVNIEIGSWYLGRARNHWKDYSEADALALCEYNAGRQRAEAWKPLLHDGQVVPNINIESTRKYVKDILERREQYKRDWKWEKLK